MAYKTVDCKRCGKEIEFWITHADANYNGEMKECDNCGLKFKIFSAEGEGLEAIRWEKNV